MNLAAALQSLWEHRQRTLLSALGVTVATVAIVLLMSIGLGVQKDVRSQVEDLGANVVVVVPGRVELMGGFNPNLAGQSWFEESDRDAIRAVSGVRNVAILSFVGGGITAEGQEAYPFLIATTPEWFVMRPVDLAEGRLLREGDTDAVVLGSVAKELLFGETPAAGRKVQVNGKPYTVVGVTREKEQSQSLFSMQSLANVAYLPYAGFKQTSPDAQIDRFMIQTDPEAEPEALVARLEATLGERLSRQQFSVLTQEDLLGVIYKLFAILSTLVVGLTSIALFVGWFGIMTVMLMAVNERRKEIGVRKATGARQRDVFSQFLAEAVLIGATGVAVGVLISAVVCALLAQFTAIKPMMTPGIVGLAFGSGIGIGGLFGLWPAMRAARQDPVVSLRNE